MIDNLAFPIIDKIALFAVLFRQIKIQESAQLAVFILPGFPDPVKMNVF